MLNRRTVVLAACAAAAGCANKRPAHPAAGRGVYPASGVETDIHLPRAGETSSAAVGDSIVSYARQITVEWLRVLEAHEVQHPWLHDARYTCAVSVPAGDYQLAAKDSSGALFFAVGRRPLSWIYQGRFSHSDDALVDLRQDAAGGLSLVWAFPDHDDIASIKVDGLKWSRFSQSSRTTPPRFRRELVYTGRTGSTITLLYREFVGDMARPAFSQALQYDISTDPVIGYQGARFRVIAATNTSVTVEVLAALRSAE